MRKLSILTVFLLSILFSVAAQEAGWYLDKPIVDIEFIGLENVSPGELEGIKTQFIGKPFTEAIYLDLQTKLFSLNYFEDFQASAVPGDSNNSSVIIQFTIVERPLVDSISYVGNSKLRKRELDETIITKVDDILNNARIRLDAAAIKELYLAEGFPDVEVTGGTEELPDSNKVKVVFRVVEGAQTKINSLAFSGNSFASASTLKKLLTSKEVSLFNNGIFEEGSLVQDKDAILNYYYEWGYIEARIVDVIKEVVSAEDNKNLISITFYIEEGPQYTFGGITFEGNTLFSDEELSEQVRLEAGKVLNKKKLESDMIRITDMYYNDGYIFNDITTEEIRGESYELSFIMHIKEAGRAHIENIIIEGNTKTKDYVILRELPLEVGDVFSKDKIMQGLNNLNNLRYFETFVPETPQGSAPGLMDLIINVEEGRTIDLNFGITFTMEAGSLPIVGFIKWTDRNFMGKGQEISVASEVSSSTQNLTFSFDEKWLTGRRWSGGVDFSIEHSLTEDIAQDILGPVFTGSTSDNPQMVPDPYDGHWVNASDGTVFFGTPTDTQLSDEDVITDYAYAVSQGESIDSDYLMDYESFEFSLGANTGYSFYTNSGRIGLGTGISTALSYTTYDDTVFRPYDPDIRSELDLWQFINKWSGKVSYDTRDIVYSPNKGFFLSQSITYTGGILGGSRNYNKLSTIGEVYQKIFEIPVTDAWNWKSVFAFHTNLSLIFDQYAKLDTGEWGAVTNATQSDLLYTDGMVIAKGWSSAYNGKALWDNWIELRTPIVPGMVAYNSFFSGTALWDELEDFSNMELDDFKFTLGTGLQIDYPSFPMGFYFVKRFNFVDNDINWQAGNVFQGDADDSGLDFIITFNFSYF
ncbi:MAG: outer membrane protein assembly factor BamA [Spirochaetales bacterium]|nr:outer membrane protein assembly factor BamA [Spirochaetales bacterium]